MTTTTINVTGTTMIPLRNMNTTTRNAAIKMHRANPDLFVVASEVIPGTAYTHTLQTMTWLELDALPVNSPWITVTFDPNA